MRHTMAIIALVAGCASPRTVSDAELVVMVASDGSPPGSAAPSDLATMNLDGTNRTQLTHDAALEFLPHFSPDGTELVYTKFLTGTYGTPHATTDIAVYDFTTRRETLVTDRGDATDAVWSPDGATLAFLAEDADESSLWLMNPDGTQPREIGKATGSADDALWGDLAWSSDDWLVFVVGEEPTGPCFKTRLDKIRPDGTERTQVSDGGSNCTPTGMEQSGDADPGISADGQTIYTSRGEPRSPAGTSPPVTERRLVALSTDAWAPGKVETDLALASEQDCIEGVPKGSPDGTRILEFRACFDAPHPMGIYVTDTAGSYRTYVTSGFGADWNPGAR
jgi:Tol biopolymer transport system component